MKKENQYKKKEDAFKTDNGVFKKNWMSYNVMKSRKQKIQKEHLSLLSNIGKIKNSMQ